MSARDIPINTAEHPVIGLCNLFADAGKPLTRNARTATATDIAYIKTRLALATDLYRSVLKEELGRLNENLPSTRTIEFKDMLDGLADLRSNIIGRLESVEDRA